MQSVHLQGLAIKTDAKYPLPCEHFLAIMRKVPIFVQLQKEILIFTDLSFREFLKYRKGSGG